MLYQKAVTGSVFSPILGWVEAIRNEVAKNITRNTLFIIPLLSAKRFFRQQFEKLK